VNTAKASGHRVELETFVFELCVRRSLPPLLVYIRFSYTFVDTFCQYNEAASSCGVGGVWFWEGLFKTDSHDEQRYQEPYEELV
jgi:hypothetical protein